MYWEGGGSRASGELGWNPKNIENAQSFICFNNKKTENIENTQYFICFFNKKAENH